MSNSTAIAHDFFGQYPLGDKTAVLLINEDQAGQLRLASGRKPIRLTNEGEVSEFVQTIRKGNRSHLLFSALDVITNGLIQNQIPLPPTGEYSPLVPYFSRSGGPFRTFKESYIEINQNKVSAKTLAELQSQFRSASSEMRPKIVFIVEDRHGALDIFAKLNSASDLYAPTLNGVHRVNLPDKAANDFERLYFTRYENHKSAALAAVPETDDLRIDFINKLMQIKSQKTTLNPTHLLPRLKELCDLSNRKLTQATDQNRDFWATAWIHALVEQAYIQEYAELEVQTAMGMLGYIHSKGLTTHVLRFANQALGTSVDALAYLQRGKLTFETISPASFDRDMYLSSYFGLLQNMHVTELYQPTLADPEVARASYEYAKDECPYFTNLAMLGNSVALSYLTNGNSKKALEIYDELKFENADTLDRWCIIGNRLIAMHQAAGEVDENDLESFARILLSADVSEVWKYHLYRFSLNLIQMDHKNIVSDSLWDLLLSSRYFGAAARGNVKEYQNILIRKDFKNHTINGKLGGQIGTFVYGTQLFPSADFDWT